MSCMMKRPCALAASNALHDEKPLTGELVMQLHTYRTSPLMTQGNIRVKTGAAFLKAFAEVKQGEAALSLPILLVSSPTDTVSPPAV